MKGTTFTSILSKTAAVLAVCVAFNVQAGTNEAGAKSGKTPAPVVTAEVPLGISASLGYDSRYYFRGLWFSNQNVWAGLNASIPIADKLTLGVGSYYTDSTTNLNYSELDLFTTLTYDAGFAKFGLGYTWYYFFNGFFGDGVGQDYAHEIGITSIVPIGPINWNLGGYYDFYISAFYFETGFDSTIKVNDRLSIVPSVVIGYGVNGYYTFGTAGTAWNHIGAKIAFPITLTKTATLTPYVSANFSLDGREGLNTIEGRNEIFGGVSLTVSF